MALKFKLQPNPTFKATVDIPVPGAEPAPVAFEFKHYSQSGWEAYLAAHEAKPREAVFDVVVGWDLDEAFGRETLGTLLDEYPGAEAAIWTKYHAERFGARQKN
jgi:hypothetical protein